MTIATALQKERMLQCPTFSQRLTDYSMNPNLELFKKAMIKSESDVEEHGKESVCKCNECADCENLKQSSKVNSGKNKIVIKVSSDPATSMEASELENDVMVTKKVKIECEPDILDSRASKCSSFSIEQLIKKSP